MSRIHEKPYEDWTREEFEALPAYAKFAVEPNPYEESTVDCFVIIPNDTLHDSGFRTIDVVVIKGDRPVGRFANCADNFRLNCRDHAPYTWSMDWLPVSGLMRIWPCDEKCKVISSMLSFEIKATK